MYMLTNWNTLTFQASTQIHKPQPPEQLQCSLTVNVSRTLLKGLKPWKYSLWLWSYLTRWSKICVQLDCSEGQSYESHLFHNHQTILYFSICIYCFSIHYSCSSCYLSPVCWANTFARLCTHQKQLTKWSVIRTHMLMSWREAVSYSPSHRMTSALRTDSNTLCLFLLISWSSLTHFFYSPAVPQLPLVCFLFVF